MQFFDSCEDVADPCIRLPLEANDYCTWTHVSSHCAETARQESQLLQLEWIDIKWQPIAQIIE